MPPRLGPFQFGDFTFDPASGELSGLSGITRLPPQVAALLFALLEHAGSVVSRAELQARLWPDTTVEFDDGLNFAVRQLRLALGDDAGSPRYLETLPRRGYRFLPPVTSVAEGARVVVQPPATDAGGVGVGARETPGEARAPMRVARRRIIIGVSVGLGLAIVAGWLARDHLSANRRSHERIVLAIVPFVFDTTDSMMVTYQRRLLAQLRTDARADRFDSITERADGATHVLSGRLTRQGNSVHLFVQLIAVSGRHHVWADDMMDSYAFSGNSTLSADRIEHAVARVLGLDTPPMSDAPRE